MTRYAILFLISLAVFAGWENIQINDNDAGSMTGRVLYFGADYEAAVDDDYQWDDSGKILTVTGTVSATTISVSDDAYDAAWNASSDVPTKNAVYDKIESLGGGGDVSKVGTPVNNQIGVWTGDGTIEGDGSLTFDTTDDTFAIAAGGNLAFGAVDIIADVAGTTNLKNIDGIDTTTKNTIQTAIVTENFTWTGSHDFTGGSFTANMARVAGSTPFMARRSQCLRRKRSAGTFPTRKTT